MTTAFDPDTLTVVTTPPEPTPDQWRGRCLLALALANHRAGENGLSSQDTAAVRQALEGRWDVA